MSGVSHLSARESIDNDKYVNLLTKFNESGPYYTSYPALAKWTPAFTEEKYRAALKDFFLGEGRDKPVHLYVHIPFCAKLCYYCICNMTVSSDYERIQEFVNYLGRELDMLRAFFEENNIKPNIREIHLGGGTPNHLKREQFQQLCDKLSTLASLKNLDEFAMEIDPRIADRETLKFYSSLGVRRISFGVQDFNAEVQQAINRVQPFEMIDSLLSPDVRDCFSGFNFDLLFGLPNQTRETFRETLRLVKQLSPERISLLKYAHVPEVRKHMRAIKDEALPPQSDLPLMFTESVNTLLDQNYEWVGIDYFAKPTDSLGKAVQNNTVWRTFNGFTPGRTSQMIGVGPTSTAAFGPYYTQNFFEFKEYYQSIDEGRFPILRGYHLSEDDVIRRDIMFRLLCRQTADLNAVGDQYNVDHREYFAMEIERLKEDFVRTEILTLDDDIIRVTDFGRFFLRNICMIFDTFYKNEKYLIPPPVLKGKRSLM